MQTINTPACSPAALLVVSDCDLLQRLRLEAGGWSGPSAALGHLHKPVNHIWALSPTQLGPG